MKTETVAVLAIIAVGTAYVLARRAAGAVSEAVSDAAQWLWYGPASAPQDYQDSLAASRDGNHLNPFAYNPNNYKPEDLVPPGYRVNQWGGFERI